MKIIMLLLIITISYFIFYRFSYAQDLQESNTEVNIESTPIIKLHGTITNENGIGQAIISLNGGIQKYTHQHEVITKNIILEKVNSNYVLLKTIDGLILINIDSSEITENEANYDPNLENGLSRTFHSQEIDSIAIEKLNNIHDYKRFELEVGQTRIIHSD